MFRVKHTFQVTTKILLSRDEGKPHFSVDLFECAVLAVVVRTRLERKQKPVDVAIGSGHIFYFFSTQPVF